MAHIEEGGLRPPSSQSLLMIRKTLRRRSVLTAGDKKNARGIEMWKNYMLAALNVAVAGLPFLVGWDLVLYGVYCGFAVLLLGLTAWNPVGDWFSILFVFYAKAVPEEALIMPALRRYLREAISGKGYLKPKCRFYYAESRIPYFIPISRKRVVLSLALEDYLIHDYDGNLYRDVPDEAYIPNLVLSRKTLLLSIFCYVLILRFIELWTIIAAVIVRLVFAAIAVIVTGSFYEGFHKMMEAIWIGAALGKVIWKINECFNFIQDKMVEFVMKRTMTGTFDYLKKSGIPRGQGIRLRNR